MSEERKTSKKESAGKDAVGREKKNVIYVGPTIPGIAIQNTVYTEIPKQAEEAMKDCPLLGNLFVQIRDYSIAEKMIRKKEGYFFSVFMKALKYREEKEAAKNE